MNARSAIELTEFEQIEAGPGTVLLRVAARAADASVAGERPVLVITDRGRIQRLTALPAPPDPAGVLRAAFSAPVALVESASRFSLELAGGSTLDLPAPSARRRLDELAQERRLRKAAEQRAEARRRAIDELELRLNAERARREAREADAGKARAQTGSAAVGVDDDAANGGSPGHRARNRTSGVA